MKNKGLVATILFCTLMTTAIAQEKSLPFIDIRMGHSFAVRLSSFVDAEISVMKPFGTRWMMGGTFKYASFYSSAKEASDFPLNEFCISSARHGIGAVVRYNLPVECGYQSLSFKTFVSRNWIRMTAYDERFVGYDSDNDVTHTFKLENADGSEIGCPILLTLELMYTIDIDDGLSLGLTLGCDVTHYIKDSFRHKSITLASRDWNEFEKYYGSPTIIVFEETASGREMCSPVVCYFGISLGVGGVPSGE